VGGQIFRASTLAGVAGMNFVAPDSDSVWHLPSNRSARNP